MKTIKIETAFFKDHPKYFPASKTWNSYKIAINDPNTRDADFLVVLGEIDQDIHVNCPPENTIILTQEPTSVKKYNKHYLAQFQHLITCQSRIKHPNKTLGCQGYPWFSKKSKEELENEHPKKTKSISIISSNKQFTKGHKQRYKLALALKDHFKDKVDLFGRGIQPFDDKWDVTAPYKYSICIENCQEPHYFTEKIIDCFIANTIPIYYGCPNIHDYFNKDALIQLPNLTPSDCIPIIESLLDNNTHYQTHTHQIQTAKHQCLNNYHLLGVIASHITQNNLQKNNTPKPLHITPEKNHSFLHKILGS